MVDIGKSVIDEAEREIAKYPEALIAVLSPDGVFVYIWPAVERILGYERDYALGHNVSEYFKPEEVTHIMLTIEDALLNGVSVSTTRNTPLKGGGTRRMRGSMRKLVDAGTGQVYLLSVARSLESGS